MLGIHVLVLASIAAAVVSNPTATIDVGQVIGTTTKVPSSTITVNKFLGIPFAVSPPERFSPPKPVGKFSKPLIAQKWSPACIQQFDYPKEYQEFEMAVFNGYPTPVESEDCLYLNVYAPATPTKGKAVMYWLFGGGTQFGTAGQDLYDGAAMAAHQDIIIVTVNYRTNVFGFSNSPAIPLKSRNAGFYDQRLGLDWVQRNIAAFGGDPTKVTLFGQSAGADSVDRIVLSPPKPRPFRAAILQSGMSTFDRNSNTGPAAWKNLSAQLHCTNINATEELECVRAAPAVTIKSIIEESILAFSLVNDGITKLPTPVNRSMHQTVPMMIGNTGQESRLFALGMTNLTIFLDTYFSTTPPAFQALLKEAYAVGTPGITDDFDAIAAIQTDVNYHCPAAFVANESALAGFPTWRYYFNASFANTNENTILDLAGLAGLNLEAFHTSDIAFVFGTLPPNSTAQELKVSKTMQTAWADFAKNPTTTGPGWGRYGSKKGVAPVGLMRLGEPESAATSMIAEYTTDYRCAIWTEFLLSPVAFT